MARLNLEFPEPAVFSTDLEVRIDDLNYGGHVGNDRFLTLVQEARIRLFRKLGYPSEASIQGSVGMIITDASIVFKSELRYGDPLKVHISLSDKNKYGFDFYYLIRHRQTKAICATIRTGVVGFDYSVKKVVRFPEEFFERLKTMIDIGK